MTQEDYWGPGLKVFVSITSTRSRAVDSVTSTSCKIAKGWDEAFAIATKFLQNNHFSADNISMFTKPRLCDRCIDHATVPMIFEITGIRSECLCVLLKTPCGIH